jgi:glycerol kinase
MQFQADLLGVPVRRPPVLEVTALGAAALAGIAVGYWSDRAQLENAVGEGASVFEPAMGADRRDALYTGWKRAVERAMGWEGE